jgi:hypothetical protein
MTEYAVRFLVGASSYRPSRCWETCCVPRASPAFSGRHHRSASPHSVLQCTGGADYAALQSKAMTVGAMALAVYSIVVCHLLVRTRLRALPATLASLVVWLIVAFGLLTLAGGPT